MIDQQSWGTVDGFEITAWLVPDTDSHADEDWRSMGADIVAAYERGDWQYVGVVVTASRDGVDCGSDSIYGSQYGSIPGVDGFVNPLSDTDYPYRQDLIDNAVADARMAATRVTGRVAGLDTCRVCSAVAALPGLYCAACGSAQAGGA